MPVDLYFHGPTPEDVGDATEDLSAAMGPNVLQNHSATPTTWALLAAVLPPGLITCSKQHPNAHGNHKH